MCVEFLIVFRFSLAELMNNASFGFVIKTTGHSLCCTSVNDKRPWSIATKRYLKIILKNSEE